MNDPQFVEAARHLAQLTLLEHETDPARVSSMVANALGRTASALDVEDFTAAARDFRALFAKSPEAARELIETGDSAPVASLDPVELAAWTLVANILMNRDDFISKN